MQSQFESIICVKRTDETSDASTFEFKKLDNSVFYYKAGQFITFAVDVAGELEYRAYSLASTPSKPESISITIKRVAGGKVSNYLLDNLQAGIGLPAMAPAGEFTLEDNLLTNEIVLFSAGSGITPCISIARYLLDTEQAVNIHFIYSACSDKDIIMEKQLMSLHQRYDNFRVSFILEETDHEGRIKGRLNETNFVQLVPDLKGKTIFTCGPTAYMDVLKSLLIEHDFDMQFFHKESFVALKNTVEEHNETETFQIFAPQYGKSLTIKNNQTLLEALEMAGVPIIGACRSGVCGACKCKVVGDVKSSSEAMLSAEQIKQGYVLSCSSRAYSDLVVEL
ncbi:oxidoreductase FAD-binding subunit [Psychromonas sp. CNPT3]|uniref:hybrid-cluster NAD(P)-dependent oxidoreductase n=1 Tax=Psychromonas sp. CNPT3 TaxID=314282 RepID=UPI00006E9CC4|nr:hybrid-cluster NAD(P)-dependent oxidoreductase [Psychromonas sp. CNPT3]AGH80186.1 oxidoreductase FAD-binding subunit [Psychromonas sp. CNPT3]